MLDPLLPAPLVTLCEAMRLAPSPEALQALERLARRRWPGCESVIRPVLDVRRRHWPVAPMAGALPPSRATPPDRSAPGADSPPAAPAGRAEGDPVSPSDAHAPVAASPAQVPPALQQVAHQPTLTTPMLVARLRDLGYTPKQAVGGARWLLLLPDDLHGALRTWWYADLLLTVEAPPWTLRQLVRTHAHTVPAALCLLDMARLAPVPTFPVRRDAPGSEGSGVGPGRRSASVPRRPLDPLVALGG